VILWDSGTYTKPPSADRTDIAYASDGDSVPKCLIKTKLISLFSNGKDKENALCRFSKAVSGCFQRSRSEAQMQTATATAKYQKLNRSCRVNCQSLPLLNTQYIRIRSIIINILIDTKKCNESLFVISIYYALSLRHYEWPIISWHFYYMKIWLHYRLQLIQ